MTQQLNFRRQLIGINYLSKMVNGCLAHMAEYDKIYDYYVI